MGQDLEEKSQVEVTPGKIEQGFQSMEMFFPYKKPQQIQSCLQAVIFFLPQRQAGLHHTDS